MKEIDIFEGYPEQERMVGPRMRTIHNRISASYRGAEFYDGKRENGYGGMKDDGRWGPIAENIIKHYSGAGHKILQVGAHKGFLTHELWKRGMRVWGVETSHYAALEATDRSPTPPGVIESFTKLPFPSGFFDVVIATSVVYMQNLEGAIKVLKEIERVKAPTGHSWVTLGAYENESDIEGLMMLRYWFLNGTTVLTKADWLEVMKHAGYTGDYRFDTPKLLNLVLEKPGFDYRGLTEGC